MPSGRPHHRHHAHFEGSRVETHSARLLDRTLRCSAATIDSSDAAAAEITTFIEQALVNESWRKAAGHFGGQGLEQGPLLLTPALKQVARFRRQGDHIHAEGLEATICGAVWGRRARKGHRPTRVQVVRRAGRDSRPSLLLMPRAKPARRGGCEWNHLEDPMVYQQGRAWMAELAVLV